MKNTYKAVAASFLLIIFCLGNFLQPLLAVNTMPVPNNEKVLVKRGTEVNLKIVAPINSQEVENGNVVQLAADIDVITDEGHRVIKTGEYATGIVQKVQKKGLFGKRAVLEIMPVSVKAIDGSTIPLTGTPLIKKGKNRSLLSVLVGVLSGAIASFVMGLSNDDSSFNPAGMGFAVAGIFVKGSSIEIPIGEPLLAKVREDRYVNLAVGN